MSNPHKMTSKLNKISSTSNTSNAAFCVFFGMFFSEMFCNMKSHLSKYYSQQHFPSFCPSVLLRKRNDITFLEPISEDQTSNSILKLSTSSMWIDVIGAFWRASTRELYRLSLNWQLLFQVGNAVKNRQGSLSVRGSWWSISSLYHHPGYMWTRRWKHQLVV